MAAVAEAAALLKLTTATPASHPSSKQLARQRTGSSWEMTCGASMGNNMVG